jgi:antibiotic biosynthesis monooxygenase (ABM) superfamily enzyme
MYGTIWRVRLKDGTEPTLKALMDEFEARRVPGFIGHYTYCLDADPNVYMSAVVFASRETYVANANSPEMQALYERMTAVFDGEPEWFDGEITDARGGVPRA